MANIDIETEVDTERGWEYEVAVDDGTTYRYAVTLNWAEYDLWCHGRIAPQRVVRAAFEFLLKREPASAILRKFDCAIIRRYFPDVDAELPKLF